MPFDFSPFTLQHAYLFLAVFIIAFTWIGASIRRSSSTIVFAGIPLAATILVSAWMGIEGPLPLIGFIVAGLLILFIGGLDEQLKLSAAGQFVAQLAIVACLLVTGWSIPYVSNIAGDGVMYLSQSLFVGSLFLYAPLWTALWILFVMNAINWLDGVDGLASGVGISAFVVLGMISLLPSTQDSSTLTLAIIGAGVFLGFFLWNAPPAKAYLGTTGSWFLGMFIAIIAIMGGGKIATALLVLAVPLLDTLAVVITRLINKQPPWKGDTQSHIHHRLQKAGFSNHAIVGLLVGMSAILGTIAVLAPTSTKLVLLILFAVLFFATIFFSSYIYSQDKRPDNQV